MDKETNKTHSLYHSNGNTGSFIIVVNPYCGYKLIAEYKDYEPIEIDLPAVIDQVINYNNEDVVKIIFNKKP